MIRLISSLGVRHESFVAGASAGCAWTAHLGHQCCHHPWKNRWRRGKTCNEPKWYVKDNRKWWNNVKHEARTCLNISKTRFYEFCGMWVRNSSSLCFSNVPEIGRVSIWLHISKESSFVILVQESRFHIELHWVILRHVCGASSSWGQTLCTNAMGRVSMIWGESENLLTLYYHLWSSLSCPGFWSS